MTTETNVAQLPVHYAAPDVFANPDTFEHAQRVAKVFASSNLVPPHLRGNLADCLIAYQIARRLNEEPLTVFQNIYVVSGRPGWKTEYVIARANKAGVFSGRITWATTGEGDTLAVTAKVTLADTGELVTVTCDMAMAKADGWTKNAKYTSMPEHMLRWRSAAMLIRLYAPEVMLGMPVLEEVEDLPPIRDITPQARDDLRKTLDEFAGIKADEATIAPADGEHLAADEQPANEQPSSPQEPASSPAAAADQAASAQSSQQPASQGQPAAASTEPGAAKGSKAENKKGNGSKAEASAAKPGPAQPATEKEYAVYADAWRETATDPVAAMQQWKNEKTLRNRCNVSAEVREDLLNKLQKHCAGLQAKEG